MNVKDAFHERMIKIYTDAKEQCGYNASRFLVMVSEGGGLAAARTLLHAKTVSVTCGSWGGST